MDELNLLEGNIRIKRYLSEKKFEWDDFCKSAKNPLFMFHRDYMDYHSDRFVDHSLMLYYKDKLVALFPADEKNGQLRSHGGLTYGGFIVGDQMKQHIMNDCFSSLVEYCRENSISNVIYKSIPHIFHRQPCEEDLYSLFLNGAEIIKIEPSTVIYLDSAYKMAKGRKAEISRAKREGVTVRELFSTEDFNSFIDLENKTLLKRHGVTAVHSGAELEMLRKKFPNNIHLLCGFLNDRMISGTVLFEYENVVHTQYLMANDEARCLGGLDAVINYAIQRYTGKKKWLDFGISTENDGLYLNEGLISQKEGFGGRTNVYTTWEIKCVK